VLHSPVGLAIRATAGPPDERLVARLRRDGVTPLAIGRVIVATNTAHEPRVVEAIRELGLDLDLIRNRDSLMVLPRGVNKASGLLAALAELAIPPRSVVGIGDAENDCDWLGTCGCGVAVANAIPELLRHADVVTRSCGGLGVLEVVEDLLSSDLERLDNGLMRRL
jgi:hydroxymethylpyrimidine pyrophosphatase-like HAD family hydrolase